MTRKLALSLIAAAAYAAMAGCDPSTARQTGSCPLLVNSVEQLQLALNCAEPNSTIRVAPGGYSQVVVRRTGTGAVGIRSADPKRPAVFSSMRIIRSRGLILSDLRFEGKPHDQAFSLLVTKSEDIRLTHLSFKGDAPFYDQQISGALMLRESSRLSVEKCHFDGFQHGLSMRDLNGITIADNLFVRMRTDGIRGGGVSNVLVKRNILTDFYPAEGAHPDGIQFWSKLQSAVAENIEIRDNLVLRGQGRPVQGIFIRDSNNLPFKRVRIVGNLVAGARYNGIAINGATDVEIIGNSVIPYPGQASWIRIQNTRGAKLTGNQAGRFFLEGEVVQNGNRPIAANRNPSAQISGWARARNLDVQLRGKSAELVVPLPKDDEPSPRSR